MSFVGLDVGAIPSGLACNSSELVGSNSHGTHTEGDNFSVLFVSFLYKLDIDT